MVVGFTGTRAGMTRAQREVVRAVLVDTPGVEFVRHGDCVAADADLHSVCGELGVRVVLHPCTLALQRAYCGGGHVAGVMAAKPPLLRNVDIVRGSDVLVATPSGFAEELRSGTWSTVRHARTHGVPVLVVYPDGTTTARDPS